MATKKGKWPIRRKFSMKGGFWIHQTKYISLNLHGDGDSDVTL
jgi:hypothetical protein